MIKQSNNSQTNWLHRVPNNLFESIEALTRAKARVMLRNKKYGISPFWGVHSTKGYADRLLTVKGKTKEVLL